jgi:hypothetical protein
VIQQSKKELASLQEFSVLHVKRDYNRVADMLARSANSLGTNVLKADLPSAVRELVIADCKALFMREGTNGARAPCSQFFEKSKMTFKNFKKNGTKNLDIDNYEIY